VHFQSDPPDDDGKQLLPPILPTRFRHAHAAEEAQWVYMGYSEKAPDHHLYRCKTTPRCRATMVMPCRRGSLVERECLVCYATREGGI
jgi:hypothetical protein